MADTLWDYRNQAHRDAFGELLAPLIVASRSRDFVDPGRAKEQLIAWVMSLKDIPLPLLEAGVERLMAGGVSWMPRPGDLREACCDIRDELRKRAALVAQQWQQDCGDCGGTGLRPVDDAGKTVTRCNCVKRGLERIAEAGEPLKRPALPPAVEPEPAA